MDGFSNIPRSFPIGLFVVVVALTEEKLTENKIKPFLK
jgi:hypothetical protein